jgi:hypothetical protein
MESAMFAGCWLLAASLVLATLASPHRLGAAAGEGSETKWHVVSVNSLLPSTVCTPTKGSLVHMCYFIREKKKYCVT